VRADRERTRVLLRIGKSHPISKGKVGNHYEKNIGRKVTNLRGPAHFAGEEICVE